MTTPEEIARQQIDQMLINAGWVIQNRAELNLTANPGVAVREFPLKNGYADYMLFVDRKACGVIEAKPAGNTLSGVADQSGDYLTGLPDNIPHVSLPLPFAYESSGTETNFRDGRDTEPRSRSLFHFHRPETLAEWASQDSTLRSRMHNQMPALIEDGLWKAQIEAILNLEESLAQDKPRALIQMATGSGKTFTAVSFLYRLIKFACARRILFLVDRNNLGRQTLKEFQNYTTPDDGRKFTDLYNVQRLTTNAIDSSNQVVITTIQRLYSMLKGDTELDTANEEGSLFESFSGRLPAKQLQVVYNPAIPIETFDFIVTDECHRSIYNLWRQVLEYFDAHIIGLTATPSTQTLGFFNQNLVMEYSRERAVADGVNVDGQVYHIRTRIGQEGSRIESGFTILKRDKKTRAQRWEQLDEDFEYTPQELDNEVVAKNQIRTIVREFKDRLFTDIFPGRTEVPKTLVFAKDDSHAEDIVNIIREEFGRGNEFCKKITYRSTGSDPEQLIQDFRTAYFPRIAVSVDMIATGTDIRPLEVLLFMRLVKSRTYFEQMLGRGTRVIAPTDLKAVTPDANMKTHFLLIDTVGVLEQERVDTKTLERKRSVKFNKLLEQVAFGIQDEDTLLSLAGRLSSLSRQLNARDERVLGNNIQSTVESAGRDHWIVNECPEGIHDLANALLDAFDPDAIHDAACTITGKEAPSQADLKAAQSQLISEAAQPFVAGPDLRAQLITIHDRADQWIDDISVDEVEVSGFDNDHALETIQSFKQFIEDNKNEIDALQLLYSRPSRLKELTFQQIQELSEHIQLPPFCFTTEALWQAYAQLEKGKVQGAGTRRVLTDLISLVRHAIEIEADLVPFPEKVRVRYNQWLADQEAQGKVFTEEQRWWLDRIAERIGVNLYVRVQDFEYGDFFERGGYLSYQTSFENSSKELLKDLNLILYESN